MSTGANGPATDVAMPRQASDAVIILLLLFMAWLVYQPAAAGFIDYVDFPENIRVLQTGETFVGRFKAMSDVLAAAGRWSPVNVGQFAAQWSMFEWNSMAWRLVRFATLGIVVILAYALYRRLLLGAVASAFAASLLIVSPAATMGWTRLSTGEPVGMLFLLIGSHLALNPWPARSRWGMATMLLGLIWTKEILLGAWLLPVFLAFMALRRNGTKLVSHSALSVFAPSLLALVAGSVPILWTYFTADSGAFALGYGSTFASPLDVLGAFVAAVIPFSPAPRDGEASSLIPLVALLVLLLAGLACSFYRRVPTNERRSVLFIAVALPLVGALTYAPWPFYLLIYAFPFLAGGALLVGQAASSLYSSGRVYGALATACLTVILSYSMAQASNDAARTRALIDTVATTVTEVATIREIDTALVAVDPNQFDAKGNFGPRFVRYAGALGLEWPATRDVKCTDVPSPVPRRTLVVVLSAMCTPEGPEGADIVIHHVTYRWPDPRGVRDSITVTMLR